MTHTTAKAFEQFLEALTPTDYQKRSIMDARKQTVDARLLDKFPPTSDIPYSRGVLMGSASKNTIIRPFDDIAVLAVFSNANKAWDKYRNDSRGFIYRIRDAYDGLSIQQVGTRGQAVRVFYKSGGHVDIAPVFYRGNDVYHLPNGTGGWILTSPTIANAWFVTRNAELGYRLAPIVRLLKAWNRSYAKRLRSFHLETVAGTVFKSIGGNHRLALQRFFEWAQSRLTVNDPGGHSGDLSVYLTANGRRDVINSLATAAERAQRANQAEARGDHVEAKRLWQIILGDEFPTQ